VYRSPAIWPLLLILLAGCTVEPTPREYIDRQVPPPAGQVAAREAIEDRIRLLVQSLSAGDPAAAAAALSPAPDARIIGPGEEHRFEGAPQATALLELVAQRRLGLEIQDLVVRVNPRATVGWFDAILADSGPEGELVRFSATGVYQLREGTWELVQAHVSGLPDSPMAGYPPAGRAPAGVE
jgi:hypothetical protein